MTDTRSEALRKLELSTRLQYPLCWTDERTTLGDFEGRKNTVEVFFIASDRQRQFLREIREVRREVEKMLGNRVSFVFHNPRSTLDHYSQLFPLTSRVVIEGELRITLPVGGVGSRPLIESPVKFELSEAA